MNLSNFPFFLTQASSPADIERLNQQLSFLQDANTRLADSFDSFVGAVNIFFAIVIAVITVIGAVAGFLGIRTLRELVPQEVNRAIARGIESRLRFVEQVVEREAILESVQVGYLLLNVSIKPIVEFQMLRNRIEKTILHTSINQRLLKSNVIVLDLVAMDLPEEVIKSHLEKLVDKMNEWSVLILYTPNNQSPAVGHINQLKKEGSDRVKIEYAPANTRITLMERVVSAAYVSYTLKEDKE